MLLLQMMSQFENQLSEVFSSHEFYLFSFLPELQKILYVVVTVVIQVEISVFDLGGIKCIELSKGDMYYPWGWHLYGLWSPIIMKLRMESHLLFLDEIGIHGFLFLSLLVFTL